MKITLLYPPFTDLTQPNHGCAYLLGQLRANGFVDARFMDLNAELFNILAEPASVRSINREVRERLDHFGSPALLQFREQDRYYGLASALELDASAVSEAVANLRTPARFFDYECYRASVRTVWLYSQALSALSYPNTVWHHTRSEERFCPYTISDLIRTDLTATCYLLERFLDSRILADPWLASSQIIGLSLQYDDQLMSGLHIAKLLKSARPEVTVVLGGAAVTQIFKYVRDINLTRHLFRFCDAIVLREGETALCEIAGAGGDLRHCSSIPNTVTYDSRTDSLCLPQSCHYENLDSLAAPVYDYNWDLYLSPERGVIYSPTRGCYWNRCAFCDMSTSAKGPTSPSRERSVSNVISDLARLSDARVRFVFFGVDAIRPSYLAALSDAMLSSGLSVRWAAELRMERGLSPALCHQMAKSGCVAVSLGMESGSQRVLDLMNKGTTVDHMRDALKNLAGAGIAPQLMLFTNFPGESGEDRERTKQFIVGHREYWSAGFIGRFVLTPMSAVAQNPSRFGIEIIERRESDVILTLPFRAQDCDGARVEPSSSGDSITQALFPRVLPRPWAGGIDTLHSMIYYAHHGPDFFKRNPLSAPTKNQPGASEIRGSEVEILGQLREVRFDIAQILRNRQSYTVHLQQQMASGIGPGYRGFLEWQQHVPYLIPSASPVYWLTNGRAWYKLDTLLYDTLRCARGPRIVVRDTVAHLATEDQERVIGVLARLVARGLATLRTPDVPEGDASTKSYTEESDMAGTRMKAKCSKE